MDRRHALRNLGLSMGAIVATPTIISLLQSCQNDPEINWTPQFFSQDEGTMVTKLVNIILPKTDTPAASEVDVPQFIDLFVNNIMETEEQEMLRKAMTIFTDKALADSGKNTVSKLKASHLEPILASSLKISKAQEKENNEKFGMYVQAVTQGETASIDNDILIFILLSNIRGLAIWGYKTNEYIGEEILAYDPVPGKQDGCIDVVEATGGKAWSL